MNKVAAHFQKKSKMFIYSFKYPNKESGKISKNEAAEPYLEPSHEVVQDTKINLKWMNIKMLEKTVHFFDMNLIEDISNVGISKDIRSSSSHMYYYIVALKHLAKFTGIHRHRRLFSTCSLQLHWWRVAGTSSFLWVLKKILGTRL